MASTEWMIAGTVLGTVAGLVIINETVRLIKKWRNKPKSKTQNLKVAKTVNHKVAKAVKEKPVNKEFLFPYDFTNDPRLGLLARRKLRKLKAKFISQVVLILMELNNGNYRIFITKEENQGFIYNAKRYVFDIKNRYYFPDIGMYGYYFHESIALNLKKNVNLNPEIRGFINDINKQLEKGSGKSLDKKVNIESVRQAIESSGLTEIENAINPQALKRFLDNRVILEVMGAPLFMKLLKILGVLAFIILILVLIDLIIGIYNSGLIDQLTAGGKKE